MGSWESCEVNMYGVKVDFLKDGKRSSLTVDALMFGSYAVYWGSTRKAKAVIRKYIKSGDCFVTPDMTLSKSVHNMIFRTCCKPSLLERFEADEGQVDIEELI